MESTLHFIKSNGNYWIFFKNEHERRVLNPEKLSDKQRQEYLAAIKNGKFQEYLESINDTSAWDEYIPSIADLITFSEAEILAKVTRSDR